MQGFGIPLPRSCGLLPGVGARQVGGHCSQHAVRPVLLQRAHAQYRGDLMALPSLAEYAVYQPLLHSGNNIYFIFFRAPFRLSTAVPVHEYNGLRAESGRWQAACEQGAASARGEDLVDGDLVMAVGQQCLLPPEATPPTGLSL